MRTMVKPEAGARDATANEQRDSGSILEADRE